MIRTYTKKAVLRYQLVFAVILLLLVLGGGMGLSSLSEKVLDYLIIPWLVAVAFGYAGLISSVGFRHLKGTCIVSANGKVEEYFSDELCTRTKHLNGAKIVRIDTEPTELSCSVFWAENGMVTKYTISIEVVPDINNLQAYVDTLHRNEPHPKSTITLALFEELRHRLSADKHAVECEGCAEEMARAVFYNHGFALHSLTRKFRSAELLIE